MSDIVERLRNPNYAKSSTFARSYMVGAADEIERLRASLRDQFCPRPCNHRPSEFDVGDCVDAGECGCSASAALKAEGESR
jgi:hypothetical protein